MPERESPSSEVLRVVPPAAMSAVVRSESSIYVSWAYITGGGQTGTRLKWYIAGLEMGQQDFPISSVTHVLIDLNPNTQYLIRAFGLKDDEESNASQSVTETTKPASSVPASPTNLTATPTSDSMALTWTGPDNASNYKVSYGLAPSGPVIDTSLSHSTHHTISGLASGTQYYFDVRSSNNIGDSPPTRLVKQTLQVPAMPTGLSATPGVSTMGLEWTASTGAVDYVIRYGVEPNGETNTVIVTPVRETLSGLIKNLPYFIEVSARNDNGKSNPARITKRTLDGPPVPSRPRNLVAVDVFDKVQVAWSTVSAPWYEVAYGLHDKYPITIDRYDTQQLRVQLRYLAPGTLYFIEVRAFNESGYSPPASTTVAIGPDRTRPRNLRNPGRTFSEARLTWDRPEDASYLIDYEITCPGRPSVRTTECEYVATGLVAGRENLFTVQPRRAPGLPAARSASISVTTYDRVPPIRPKSLKFKPLTPDSALLEWDASEDNVWVTGYEVRRNNGSWTSVSGTSYPISSFIEGETEIFEVRAKDAAGNLSLPATVKFGSANPDQTPPSRPDNLAVRDIGYFDATLTWDPSTDNIGVAQYRVYQGHSLIDAVEQTRYQVSRLKIDTPYTFNIRAVDAVGNLSAEAQIEFRTLKDLTPPEKPTGLLAINVSSQAAILVWATPADDLRVTHNVIVQDGRDIDTIERPIESGVEGYLAKGLTPGTTHRFAVAALDAAGNRSALSNAISVQTPMLDPPQAIQVINITRQGFELRWSPPQNSIGVSGYRTRIDNHAGSSREVHSPLFGVAFIGLRSASTYTVSICAHDVSDRYSAPAVLDVTTLSKQ
jgi:chitodextrinase